MSIFLKIGLFLITYIAFGSSLETTFTQEEQNAIDIFKKISPLVVNIHKINHVVNPHLEFVPVETGSGSGFLWDPTHIVTNYHVVQGAHEVVVTFKHGRTLHATLVGYYRPKDIAVLRLHQPLNKKTLPNHFPIADSATLAVGQTVFAIGNPFGLEHTMTKGIISALNRDIPNHQGTRLNHLIQTDASINPGNSGGPLLNSRGELIGMNTAIYSTSGSSAGIGFAILSNDIRRIVDTIIQQGHVKQSGIGVIIFNDNVAQQLSLPGVLIHKIVPHTPADRAGLRGTVQDASGHLLLGDVIVSINNTPTRTTEQLIHTIESLPIGERIQISFIRQGKRHTLTLQTAEMPHQP